MSNKALEEFKSKVGEFCREYHRNANDVKFVVASKYFSVDQIQAFYNAGVRDFGENRVQEFLEKKSKLPEDIRWHFLGHLQKNKVNKIVGQIYLLHSLDSFELAQKISNLSEHPQNVLIQIKTSSEESKTGFMPDQFYDEYPKIASLPKIEIQGLMTVAPKDGDAKESFGQLRQIKEKLQKNDWELSMGMSQDYPQAISEGTTLIRIGRALIS